MTRSVSEGTSSVIARKKLSTTGALLTSRAPSPSPDSQGILPQPVPGTPAHLTANIGYLDFANARTEEGAAHGDRASTPNRSAKGALSWPNRAAERTKHWSGSIRPPSRATPAKESVCARSIWTRLAYSAPTGAGGCSSSLGDGAPRGVPRCAPDSRLTCPTTGPRARLTGTVCCPCCWSFSRTSSPAATSFGWRWGRGGGPRSRYRCRSPAGASSNA